jgi:hypothetical protein
MTRQVGVPNPYYAFVGVATAAWISLASTLRHLKALWDCAGALCFWRQLVHQLRPFFFDHLAEIVGNFREIVSLKQEFVQPFIIFLHHDVIGDYPGSHEPLRSLFLDGGRLSAAGRCQVPRSCRGTRQRAMQVLCTGDVALAA